MKNNKSKGTKFVSAVILSLSVLLTVALFAVAFVYFVEKSSDASAFAVGESGVFTPVMDGPAATLEQDKAIEVIDYKIPGKQTFICAGDNLIHTDVYGAAQRYAQNSSTGKD